MNFLIFDLEFNQAGETEENQDVLISKCPMEIIQIGALKLNEKFQTISSFSSLVKPEVYRNLQPFVEFITGIDKKDLSAAKPFDEVYKEFVEMIDDTSILCVWGMADIKELFRNAQYYNLDTAKIPKVYINVQKYASQYLHCSKRSLVGLRNAVEILKIPIKSRFHDAYWDAYYTSEIFKYIYNDNIKVDIYQPDKAKNQRQSHKKTRLDTDRLIKQFEKMYDREMTEEEKAMIKLAYLMGRTSQFQIDEN